MSDFSHFTCKSGEPDEEKEFFITSIGDGEPTEIQMFPYGEIGMSGAAPFIVDDAAMNAAIRSFEARGLDMVIDYEHQTEGGKFSSPDGTAPAAGWIKKLVNKGAQGLWAVVEWTERAKQLLGNREYRYYSPVFVTSKKDRRLVEVLRVALTNAPRLNNIRPITAKQKEEESMWWKAYIAKLGLKEDATEADVTAALEAKFSDAPKVVIAKEVLTALGLQETAGQSEVIGTILALKQKPDLAQEVASLKQRLAEQERDDLVEAAAKAGKISPAMLDWAKDLALKDPEAFKVFTAKAPVVVPVEPLKTAATDPAAPPDEAVLQVAKMFGNTADDLKKYAKIGA